MKSNKRIKSNLAMFLLTMGACTAGRAQESPATQPEDKLELFRLSANCWFG